jgi:hypothetical protein
MVSNRFFTNPIQTKVIGIITLIEQAFATPRHPGGSTENLSCDPAIAILSHD